MSGRLYISTFGCQMNEYDSARMADVLRESAGLELTADPEDADVVLLNTCSVREKAQEKVFSHLGQWRLLKSRKPALVIGVGGCVAGQGFYYSRPALLHQLEFSVAMARRRTMADTLPQGAKITATGSFVLGDLRPADFVATGTFGREMAQKK